MLTYSPLCMPLGMRRSTSAPDHAPYFATLSGLSTTPPYVRRPTLPTYGPLPSGAWAPEPLLFPLSGMGLALLLPQRAVQACFYGLSSPHLHQVLIIPIGQLWDGAETSHNYQIRMSRITSHHPSTTPPSQWRRSGRPWPLCLPHQPQGRLGSLGRWSNMCLSPSLKDLPHFSMPAWTKSTTPPCGDKHALLCSRNPIKRTLQHPGHIGLSCWRSALENC